MRRTLFLIPALAFALSGVAQPGWVQQTAHRAAAQPPKIIQLSAETMAGRRISGDMPVYPAIAKTAHIQGTVVLRALISSEGKIEHLRVISGPPMLQAAAVDAVRTWTYEPYLLNGQPVTVRTQINVIFTLAGRPPEPIANQLVASARAPSPNGRNRAVRVVRVNVTPPLQTTDSSPEGSQPPAHPITAEQVHEMMQLTGAVNLTKQMLDGMMPTLRQSMPAYMPPDVLDDFEKTLLGSDFEAMMVRTYQAHLSSEDAAVVIAFYKTPAGQHMLAAMPQIAKDSQAAGEQLGQQVMMEVLQRHQTEIEAAKEKYETQHPWSAPKN